MKRTMFERTVSFWRRLVSRKPEPTCADAGATAVAEEERRAWQRFPADLATTVLAVNDPDARPLAAPVFDISASGVGLRVHREVANGTLLSVELQAGHSDFKRTMLACVVHVTARADATWALGCNFIRSLSEADLKALA